MQIQKVIDRKKLDEKVVSMPWFVQQFIDYKLPDLSPSTLLEYVRDYEQFFSWLRAEGLTAAQTNAQVTLHDLEILHMESIVGYRLYLTTRTESTNSKITVSRKMSSLRSLFHYLSQIAEDENFYPLLKRNIMAKVEIKRIHKPKDTAAKLKGKILEEDELTEFIAYIAEGYGRDVADNKQALYAYELNKERDACIVSLILNSGLRVSEVVNLNIDDLDLANKLVYVYRKGNNDESFKTPVYFREQCRDDLAAYLTLRTSRYRTPKREKALFVAIPNGQKEGKRMTKRAIQAMIIKYAKRFGKPYLTVHKLRHSFATDYYLQNDIYKTKEQLGHASTETTEVYAHLTDKTMSEAIERRVSS
ncbi:MULTISPECIES: tyrosine recombinase XerS [Paenibacillus]|jgi:site-specific recombinase XerD|uniref:Site-specific recombinase XerD n=1 Tax=Paenibacillus barengoltzii J12 TaxID=935846 RepID=A0ABY1LUM6_9BACL|nr:MULTISPECIES: tyrosine recombinase XerS [Paenibacillus]MDU0330087.1 tyrosine recombinase XerS [Paenibacillus sp. 3LSP]MEC2344069.1 tyrosine recombinase XerS [Paenibacillus barengoltzii]SME91231.1 Site-specific recombinase XerD [Paenibacillus barengoltzii]SMF07799.1 Site-specific recombinase XerD [Paenibacillus barengoltzii J12]